MTELPNYAWVVRDKDGDAIATYAEPGAAYAHADRDPGTKVTYDHHAAQNPGPRRSPWTASARPIGWPYKVHPDAPPSQQVYVLGPRTTAWLNVGPAHMEGDCIVGIFVDETGTQYQAVQGPVFAERVKPVLPTSPEGYHSIAYIQLWRYAGAVTSANITMVNQSVHREEIQP